PPITADPVGSRLSSVRWRGDYNREVPDPEFVETDDRGRITLPGRPNSRFLLRHNADGSIILQPAQPVPDAQYEYWSNPELRTLLTAAATSRTVHRMRDHRD
ncbi:hypothetical protein, partial [Mycobacterium lehmannii]|uniref:hypothetical protein n=1 Tax=Mycobacterium lehmannii TaxID=2048550 RepID=UPI001E60CB60